MIVWIIFGYDSNFAAGTGLLLGGLAAETLSFMNNHVSIPQCNGLPIQPTLTVCIPLY